MHLLWESRSLLQQLITTSPPIFSFPSSWPELLIISTQSTLVFKPHNILTSCQLVLSFIFSIKSQHHNSLSYAVSLQHMPPVASLFVLIIKSLTLWSLEDCSQSTANCHPQQGMWFLTKRNFNKILETFLRLQNQEQFHIFVTIESHSARWNKLLTTVG